MYQPPKRVAPSHTSPSDYKYWSSSATTDPLPSFATVADMPSHLGGPYHPPPWGYSDRLPPMGPAVDLAPTNPPIITIYEVSPQQGYEGTTVRISCDLRFPDHRDNRIRVAFGNVAVETTIISPAPGSINDNYIVSCLAPPMYQVLPRGSPTWSVPCQLEALTEPYGVVERVNLGDFHYLGDSTTTGGTPKRARKRLDDSPGRKPVIARNPTRRRRDEEMYGQPMNAAATFVYDSPPSTPQPGLMRTTQMLPNAPPGAGFVVRTKARLEIEGDLSALKNNWSADMWEQRRCLVEFNRRQVGATVHATFKPVEQKDWQPNMIVISCLWHEARNDCFFTSVDAIYLLESLMGARFTTEEKNRIRRNLESFKPTTLQKNEGQWQDFYAHIMNYPNPKPRNIDKGLKVFPWIHLEQALKKIFGNYSACVNPVAQFNFTPLPMTMSPHGTAQVAYGHHHASSDPIAYDRPHVHHAHHASTGSASAEDLSAYVDMSPATNTIPYHRQGTSSGASASAASELVSPYSVNADGDFNSYVNMSPTTTPTVPREPYGAQLGLYLTSQVDPNITAETEANPSIYTQTSSSRTASNSDLRVAYEQRPGMPSHTQYSAP